LRRAARGEVWLVDLGMAAKVRPALMISVPTDDIDRSLVTLVPRTTALRQSRFETVVPALFLKAGAFDAQGIVTVPTLRLIRPLGALSGAKLEPVEKAVLRWLGVEGSGT
jgi:mRNA interferase MazF